MKKRFLRPVSLLLAVASICLLAPLSQSFAADHHPIRDSATIKGMEGRWEGSGELRSAADGNAYPVEETWTGKIDEAGNFSVSGERTLAGNEQTFSMEFLANGDLLEGQMKTSDSGLELRFEVIVEEETRTVRMKVPLPGGGGVLSIANQLSEDGTRIDGTVELVDDGGTTTVTGEMVHKKKE